MPGFVESELTQDGFLAGKLEILQPKSGYRAGTDPVFLAAAVNARPGQSVLELGCGAGVASLCLGYRVAGLALTGVELQAAYADLARRNAAGNKQPMRVVTGDVACLPDVVRQDSFDHVIANPPYLRAGHGTPAADNTKERAFREQTPLSLWIDTAIRRLRPKGYLTVIHRSGRLPEMLALLDDRVGSLVILPLAARRGADAGRCLIRAQKGGRAEFRLCAPLVLHEGARHDADRENYSHQARAVLREGAAIDF